MARSDPTYRGRRVVTSLTAISRASSEHHERHVMAARALENERRVSIVRVVAFALFGISQALVAGLSGEDVGAESPYRVVFLITYGLFALGTVVAVHRASPNPRRAQIAPLIMTTFDAGFVLAMAWCDHVEGEVELEATAVVLALVIAYCILRYSLVSLVYATILSIATFAVALLWAGSFRWGELTFIAFAYVALALLLGSTRRAMRRAFVDLLRRETLSRLVAPKVVDQILAGREAALRPSRREVTMIFADIRGFTTFSESREPEDVLLFLDDYLGRMTQVVQGHDGSVNKFIGDGLLALWGAPETIDDHAERAVRAAIDMQKVVGEINVRRAEAGEPPVQIGIGVHTGTVAAGMLGSRSQAEYTVIGDGVNLASRIEGLTKEHGVGILVTDATWQRLAGRFDGREVGEVTVKGRRTPVIVHAVNRIRPA